MQIGMIGMGRMGANMARRLHEGGHEVIIYDRRPEKVKQPEKEGMKSAGSAEELAQKLKTPRVVWIMLPSGQVTENKINKLKKYLSKNDIIIDGSNGYYKDDIRRSKEMEGQGLEYIDAGVSGGIWGLEKGYAIMAGGKKKVFDSIETVIKTLAPEGGYMYCGPAGSGHFVKMIHNGIEYAMMEAYGEGFELIKASPYGKSIDLRETAGMWNKSGVIRSWLLELLENIFSKDNDLKSVQGYVQDSGEARWAVKEAVDSGVAADVIAASLFKRFNSRQKDVFANKITAALRNEFGGHSVAAPGDDVRAGEAGAGQAEHSEGDK